MDCHLLILELSSEPKGAGVETMVGKACPSQASSQHYGSPPSVSRSHLPPTCSAFSHYRTWPVVTEGSHLESSFALPLSSP